jgi:hypothetical protein
LAKLKALPKFEALAPIPFSLEIPSGYFISLAKLNALPKFEALAPIYFQDLP